MDTEDGDFEVCGSGGSPEDVLFDELVGHIEDFMVNFDMDGVLHTLPSSAGIPGDHERHAVFKQFLAQVESALDAHVLATCPQVKDIATVAQLLESRRDEISEEVWEFVSEGCFDYSTFNELWAKHSP